MTNGGLAEERQLCSEAATEKVSICSQLTMAADTPQTSRANVAIFYDSGVHSLSNKKAMDSSTDRQRSSLRDRHIALGGASKAVPPLHLSSYQSKTSSMLARQSGWHARDLVPSGCTCKMPFSGSRSMVRFKTQDAYRAGTFPTVNSCGRRGREEKCHSRSSTPGKPCCFHSSG